MALRFGMLMAPFRRPGAGRSHELFVDHVMPRFEGSADRILAAEDYARSRWDELDGRHGAAIAAATERHAQERAGAQA